MLIIWLLIFFLILILILLLLNILVVRRGPTQLERSANMDEPHASPRHGKTLVIVALALIAAVCVGTFWFLNQPPTLPAAAAVVVPAAPPPPAVASAEQVHQFCGACHAYPPADTFPKAHWRKEIRTAYDFFRDSALQMPAPSMESVSLYYENRAPLSLPPAKIEYAAAPPPVRLQPTGFRMKDQSPYPAVTNVSLGPLFDKEKRKLDIIVCDARLGQVLALQSYATPPKWHVLGQMAAPCHAEVIDLDGDGINDVLVACLGSFPGTNAKVGSVVWLKGSKDGTFTPITLLENVGRVADVQAADFRKVGKTDLVVAVFGFHQTGAILYLENHTTDWNHPVFVAKVLDDRPGSIHVCIGDIDNDGRDDIVALISQEHETIVAFVNEGANGKDGCRFRKEVIYTAPHPAYGSSGIQLVDLNGDNKLDVLYTNGDILDPPYILKPYHGVQWLENAGRFPFIHHPLTPMYGAMRAVAAEFRPGSGRKDIVAVSCLFPEVYPQRAKLNLGATVYLEQTAPGQFVRHSLEKITCDHFTCAAGDLDGSGQVQLVTGNFCWSKSHRIEDSVVVWKSMK